MTLSPRRLDRPHRKLRPCGNWAATSRAARSAVIAAFSTDGSSPGRGLAYRTAQAVPFQ